MSRQQLHQQDNERENEKQYGQAIYAVHVADEIGLWPVRVRFAEIEIFRYLLQDSHEAKLGIMAQAFGGSPGSSC